MRKREDSGWPDFWPGKITQSQKEAYANHKEHDLYREIEDDTFHIGQQYSDKADVIIECCICGGREFNVGQGNYHTTIRCKVCEWEVCIHNG